MFRDNKRPIVLILVLYLIAGTMDFADKVAREREADVVALANHEEKEK